MSKFGHPTLKTDGRKVITWQHCDWQPCSAYRELPQWRLLDALHELRMFQAYLKRRG